MVGSEIEEYLARARQAENSAKEAHSLVARRCWQVIAQEYRALAAQSRERKPQENGSRRPA